MHKVSLLARIINRPSSNFDEPAGYHMTRTKFGMHPSQDSGGIVNSAQVTVSKRSKHTNLPSTNLNQNNTQTGIESRIAVHWNPRTWLFTKTHDNGESCPLNKPKIDSLESASTTTFTRSLFLQRRGLHRNSISRYLPSSSSSTMVLSNDIDLLHPPADLEKRKHKLKRLVQSPNSFFMDVKCQGCFTITTVFSHSQTVVMCAGCATVLCQPTGGRARLTEGCSFRKKGEWM